MIKKDFIEMMYKMLNLFEFNRRKMKTENERMYRKQKW